MLIILMLYYMRKKIIRRERKEKRRKKREFLHFLRMIFTGLKRRLVNGHLRRKK